ncbi:MAG: NHL repeat-containing protein [Phycisphaerae bacterium]|nr:NHL repeat-containing protein [Phycisphaerae bacterium]
MLVAVAVCMLQLAPAHAQAKVPSAPTRSAAACTIYGQFTRQLDELERPVSIAFASDGRCAIVEADARRVRVIARDGVELARFEGNTLPWSLATGSDDGAPLAVAFGPDDRLTLAAPRRIATFARDGSPWRLFTGVASAEPVAIAWRGTELLVADRALGVLVLSAEGVERQRIRDGLLRPGGIAVAPNGGFFVSDEDRHVIARFAPDGTLEKTFGDRGAFPGLFNGPRGLAISGDCLYVADELNHRIEVLSFDGEFRGQWGMHAVVPREGAGKIHYPTAIAIAPDGSSAIVAEPFERRIQTFVALDASSAAAATMPALGGVQSHFGASLAADGDLLLLHEPETASVFVFDLRGATPIHVTTFGGAGAALDRFSRIVGLGVDAIAQRVVSIDGGNQRLAVFQLARDRAESLKMDPFMARLVRSWTFDAWATAVASFSGGAPKSTLAPSSIARAPDGWWIYDALEGLIVGTDARLAPRSVLKTGVRGGTSLAADANGFAIAVPGIGAVELLDAAGDRKETIRGEGATRLIRPTSVAYSDSGALVITDAATDRVLFRRGATLSAVGARGISDGDFWQPDGVCAFGGGRVAVVDRGNHRAQVLTNDGAWVMTFGLGRAYTKPRSGGES